PFALPTPLLNDLEKSAGPLPDQGALGDGGADVGALAGNDIVGRVVQIGAEFELWDRRFLSRFILRIDRRVAASAQAKRRVRQLLIRLIETVKISGHHLVAFVESADETDQDFRVALGKDQLRFALLDGAPDFELLGILHEADFLALLEKSSGKLFKVWRYQRAIDRRA